MTPSATPRFALRDLLGGSYAALVLLALATLAAELGVYFLARGADVSPVTALASTLAVCAVWTALACPAAAAGAPGEYSALFRAAIPADASAVTLLVLWPLARDAQGPLLTFAAVAEMYLILAAIALFSVAAVRLPRSPAGRQAAAVIVAVLLVAACASPFWTGGLVERLPAPAAGEVLSASVYANPFYGMTAASVERTRFLWYEWGLVYSNLTSYAPYPMPPLQWHPPALFYGALALLLGLAQIVRRRLITPAR